MSDEGALAARILEAVLAADATADVEVAVAHNRLALTRFANSVIHQNVAEDTLDVTITMHRDGRTISGSSTGADGSGFEALVERTVAAARVAPRDPGWPGLTPSAEPADGPPSDPGTVAASPEDRASKVKSFVDAAGGLETAGYCRTSHWTGALANSAGQAVSGECADISMDAIARRPGSDGAARASSGRLADVDGAILGARAAAKANAGIEPLELPPDRYEVVLEPTAVADILETFSLYAFNAKAVAERSSFVRVGDAQFDPAIAMVDDALATGSTYDAEGTPRRRLVLVDGGTTVALTHDRRTAAAAGATSTGHAIGSPSFGAVAQHLQLVGGDATASVAGEVDGPAVDAATAELVAGVERGLLVTDLWYTRVLDPRSLAVTGLTRNGVWLIEHGQVTTPLRNFRFTQSYAQALMPGAVRAVGRVAAAMPGDTYTASTPRWTAPALRLASWNFTGGASG